MSIYRYLALLVIVVSLIVYLLTYKKKKLEVLRQPEKLTVSSQKAFLPESTAKNQQKLQTNVKDLNAVEHELSSLVNLESEKLHKVFVRGYVYDPKSQPLKDARVSLEMDDTDNFKGTIVYTDENGYFEINDKFLQGKYVLTVQYLKYKKAEESIEINANRDEVKYIMLENYGR